MRQDPRARFGELLIVEQRTSHDPQVARKLADVEAKIRNLTAIAAGGAADVSAVVGALRELEARRRALVARTSRSLQPRNVASSRTALEAQLRSRFDNWRGLLRQNVTDARPVLETLLGGRIMVTPRPEGTFDVRVPLTMRGVFEGIGFPLALASPEGFEPSLPA